MPAWYFLYRQQAEEPAWNMAVDEYLFSLCHQRKMGVLRLYSWSQPTFSLGVSQKAAKALDLDFVTNKSCAVVRRITGGKAVLHNDEITYSLAASEDYFIRDHDLYRSYLLISRILAEAFKRIGVEANLARGSSSELSRSHNPCFSFPTPNEIEVSGKKIVGSAQKRDGIALLQHGSIPITMDYALYAGGTRCAASSLQKSMSTLAEISDRNRDELVQALRGSFQDAVGVELQPFDGALLSGPQFDVIHEKYSSPAWNLHP